MTIPCCISDVNALDKDAHSNKETFVQMAIDNGANTLLGPSNDTSEESVHNDLSRLLDISKTGLKYGSKNKPEVAVETVDVIKGLRKILNKAKHYIPQT